MLRKEQNDLLTQTGPATRMGAMFRRYWIPALLSEELPANDCAPVRVKLLAESLLAFRDSQGRYGLISEFCAHRGVSLWFGTQRGGRPPLCVSRLEIRRHRPVHRRALGAFRERLLPAHQADGLSAGGAGRSVVTYMGPADMQPPLPQFEFSLVPPAQTYTSKQPAGMQLAAGDGGRHRF